MCFIFKPKIANMLLEKLPEFTEDDGKYVQRQSSITQSCILI